MLSDVHCDKNPSALKFIEELIELYNERIIVASGDWGFCGDDFFKDLSDIASVYTIYGNNDDVEKLRKYFNLIEDGEVFKIEGIGVGGINGIISPKGTPNKYGVPRKKPEEFLSYAKLLSKRSVDLLLLHETPYLPNFFGKMWRNVATLTALDALLLIKPKYALIGHLHAFKCKIGSIEEITIIHVDSLREGYALFRGESVRCGEGRAGQRRARAPHPWPLDDPAP
ncbi:hypothetical protein IPA_04255 [Ignicoccus pacificus DSM 13166]|uniref:Calcineurin-like phosphoesterase domain-containing protein n=1 Tax=Ignicoccus pacificus DSM 13166 TaxID=940294 RepID=A0A977KCL2_9CREN|nr:hypothetical protein IPA_04255 [Ignicoccus pacificus DSM 13166]